MDIYETIPAGFRPIDFDLRMITFGPFSFQRGNAFYTTDRVIYRTDEHGENMRVFVGIVLDERPDRIEWVPIKTLYRGCMLTESWALCKSRDAAEFLSVLKGKHIICEDYKEVSDPVYKNGKPQTDQLFTHSVPTFMVY